MTFELQRSNQSSIINHQHIPQLGGPEITGQSEHTTDKVNISMFKAVGVNNILYQSKKPIHIFTGCDASPFALVLPAALNLFLPRRFPVAPEYFDGIAGLNLKIYQINCHTPLFTIPANCGPFFL